MPDSIKYPATVKEACRMAAKLRATLSEFLESIGPLPMPPADYTLAPGCSDRWIGPEVVSRRWIITPAWDATTDTHSLEVWMADHTPPTYGNLTPEEARELGAALIQAAQAADSAV